MTLQGKRTVLPTYVSRRAELIRGAIPSWFTVIVSCLNGTSRSWSGHIRKISHMTFSSLFDSRPKAAMLATIQEVPQALSFLASGLRSEYFNLLPLVWVIDPSWVRL